MFLAFFRALAAFAFLVLIAPLASDRAQAEIYVAINKAAQRMTVMVDGRPRYNWAISSGLNGGPPAGVFRPQRLEAVSVAGWSDIRAADPAGWHRDRLCDQ